MRRIIDQLFDTSQYKSVIERERARMIYGMGALMLTMIIVFLLFARDEQGISYLQTMSADITFLFYILLFLTPTVASLILTRIGRLFPGSIALILSWGLLSAGVMLNQQTAYTSVSTFILTFVILLCGLLFNVRGLFVGAGVSIVLVLVRASTIATPSSVLDESFNVGDSAFVAIASIVLVGGFTYLFLRYANLSRTEGAALANDERLKLAEITTQVSQRISHRNSLSAVLSNAVEQIQTSYPAIYHAQIFLVDETRQKADLVASTGQVGRMLLERQHSLGVGSLSVIGQVTHQGKTIVARAGAQDGIHRRNEFLPDTAVEAAFPLRIGDTIIGTLDMQSKERDAFADDDIPMFQSLADHLAIAIDNARLFEQTEDRLRENHELVEQTRRAAEEVERLNQQLTGRFWDEYLQAQSDSLGLNIDFNSRSSRSDEEWTPALQEAVTFNHPIMQREENGGQTIAVPLRVRGQVIGAMEFELDETGNLMPEDLNLLEEVGEQLGLAAESNRLFETSQRVAQREALVNEIATRLQASNNVEMTLSEAARSLRSALNANRVAIRLGTPPTKSGHKDGGK
jgi:GAF domain-containing protein